MSRISIWEKMLLPLLPVPVVFVILVKMEEIICVAMAMAMAMVLMGGSLNILGWVNKT